MKALFIGGTGNISLSISKKLLVLGWELTVLNRGSSNDLLPEAKFIKADMADEADVASKLEGLTYDVVAQFIAFKPEQIARDLRLFKSNRTHGTVLCVSLISLSFLVLNIDSHPFAP